MTHPNEEMVRRGYDAFSQGDMATIDGQWEDDIVWRSYGNSPFAGEYRGKQAVFELFGTIPQETDTFELELHDVLANDEHAVALLNVRMTRKDRTFEGQAVHVFHVNDAGKVTEAWYQPIDESAVPDGFWD